MIRRFAAALNFLMNTPPFLETMRRATGCERISSFYGGFIAWPVRIILTGWHDDLTNDGRLVGSACTWANSFEGGFFVFATRIGVRCCANCLTSRRASRFSSDFRGASVHGAPLEGTVPKTAFAGWFQGRATRIYMPDYTGTASARALKPGMTARQRLLTELSSLRPSFCANTGGAPIPVPRYRAPSVFATPDPVQAHCYIDVVFLSFAIISGIPVG